jgi:simple sugar transport system substrate-binding protein
MNEAGVPVEKLVLAGTDPTRTAETMRAYLRRHPDLDAIYLQSPIGGAPDADGTMKALEEENRLEKTMIVGNGLSEPMADAIQSGRVLATMDQQLYLQGYLAVETLALYLDKRFAPVADVKTGPYVVNKTNIRALMQQAKEGLR